MPEKTDSFLKQLNRLSKSQHNLRQIIAALSIIVILIVFWSLKLTGIGVAGEAFCGMEEHTHSEECLQKTLICTLEETEGHIHSESCLRRELICGQEEREAHAHEDACWTTETVSVCELKEEGHEHTEECLTEERKLICEKEACEGHTHEDVCYAVVGGFDCGKEACEGHTHGDACYEIAGECPLEEHIHTENCYSDITADLETADDWEQTFADMTQGPTIRENVVLVAQSQLGYTESTLNFQVDENGVRRGITRYGQWYGNPYGDWSAMFASFCLEYAGAQDAPANAGAESMRLEWEKAGLFESEVSPEIGNLIFLHKGEDAASGADAVAIITGYDETTISVIEGDLDNAVAETKYDRNDPVIMGYGIVPEPMQLMMSALAEDRTYLGSTISYNTGIFNSERSFVIYAQHNGQYYALASYPASGMETAVAGVPIEIDADGKIYTNAADADNLLWTFIRSDNYYRIRNVATGRYLHPGGDYGIIYDGDWPTALQASGTGAKFVHTESGNNVGIYFNGNQQRFEIVRNKSDASTLYFGAVERYTVWLDGTDGGLGHLTGSPDTPYTVQKGSPFTLPETWTSPSKYSYKLRGWYDIVNSRYYLPGEEMEVTGNTVLYADWVAGTYDIGRFNAHVADTVSTNSFITTYMFDYNYLFNIHSARAQVTVDASGHSETWSMVTSGTVNHGNSETLDFVFVDNDSGGLLCIPNNRSSHNVYPGAGIVTSGIYSGSLRQVLFATDNCYDPETDTGILGKNYLGRGDHLFQIMDDPADEHYGYYYYDSQHNAASYNQSRGRFYVYDYLSATSDAIGSTNSDFLPLNSPYANTNGKTVGTYNYDGVDGEYAGVPHYRYDSKYNSGNYNSANNVQTDYAYGMRSDIRFYLPNDPGSGGNKDLYGNDIQFQFSGDDDLWVLIDGKLVLDIGGIHGAESGYIDFSTGQVVVQGNQKTSLMDLGIGAGDHTLSVLYLERGSSLSNCSIYFNLAPRFGLEIKKEDVLTQKILNGTQFTVYEDFECTEPATLWVSEEAYNQDSLDGALDQAKSTFTVVDGVAELWGLGLGNTYYIKETKPPDAEGYGHANGVIRLTIEKEGMETYRVDVIADAEGNEPSNGFTVHGVNIDEETKTVHIVATNAPESVVETTTVQVIKKWEDTSDHSGDYIQSYLTVTDPDGTVRRIREITLSDENNWRYTWTNLPKYDYDALTEVVYGIEESYESGYYSTVRKITKIEIPRTEWAEATAFINGESYLLKHSSGYLSTVSASDGKLKWVNEETAKGSSLALWEATVSGGKVKLTNGAGQILTFNNGNSSSSRYFYTTTDSSSYQSFTPVDAGTGFRFYATRSNRNYYMASSGINSSGRILATESASSGLILIPMKQITQTDVQEVEDWAYLITNTPLAADNETSMSVKKDWVIPEGYDPAIYQEFTVTVHLLANGVRTGRSITLDLKNGWAGSFLGLPYADDNGNVIQYAVEEAWEKEKWNTSYGEVIAIEGSPPVYSVTVTNTYHPGGPELPSTGSAARLTYVLCGLGIMLSALVYAIGSRRKRERRLK